MPGHSASEPLGAERARQTVVCMPKARQTVKQTDWHLRFAADYREPRETFACRLAQSAAEAAIVTTQRLALGDNELAISAAGRLLSSCASGLSFTYLAPSLDHARPFVLQSQFIVDGAPLGSQQSARLAQLAGHCATKCR